MSVRDRAGELYHTLAATHGTTLDEDTFCRFVAERAATDEDVAALVGADVFFVAALSVGDPRALARFEAEHIPAIDQYLAKSRATADEVDEVKQRVRERLFVADGQKPAKILQYSGRHPFGAWLRAVVMSQYQTLRRRQRVHEEVERLPLTVAGASPELELIRSRARELFGSALKEAFAALDPSDKQLLRLKFGQELTLDAMAIVVGVHRATIARQLSAAKTHLWRGVVTSLSRSLAADEEEIAKLGRELESRLDISLSGLFKSEAR